jgi:Zn-dependent protease with chaperone function
MIFDALIFIGAFALAASVTFAVNWLALIPWRKNKDKHWTEQARLLYPASSAARSNLFMVPAILTLAFSLLWPDAWRLWPLVGILSMVGAYGGTLFLDHEVFPRIPVRDLLRQAVIGWLTRFLIWFVFLSAAVLMPDNFDLSAWGITGTVVLLWVIWKRGGWFWWGQKLGFLTTASERLQKIANETSARMHVPFKQVFLMRSSMSQAYAAPGQGILVFTERLMERLSDNEISAICAHELAHLTEPKSVRFSRSIRTLYYFPWIFFTPLLYNFGMPAFMGLLAITIVVPRIYGQISRKLESRADTMAKAYESDPGTYARALEKIYEDQLIPAVTRRKRATHPDLYDRLLAAGTTPDFTRPAPAEAAAWYGKAFSMLAGALFCIFVIRFVQSHYAINWN